MKPACHPNTRPETIGVESQTLVHTIEDHALKIGIAVVIERVTVRRIAELAQAETAQGDNTLEGTVDEWYTIFSR